MDKGKTIFDKMKSRGAEDALNGKQRDPAMESIWAYEVGYNEIIRNGLFAYKTDKTKQSTWFSLSTRI